MKRRFKTKQEFIESAMDGEKWEYNGLVYCYDETYFNPFRVNAEGMPESWKNIIKQEFTLVEHEPVYETRWKMLRDLTDTTDCADNYYNQKAIDANWDGWYKHPSDFIEVEVKGDS